MQKNFMRIANESMHKNSMKIAVISGILVGSLCLGGCRNKDEIPLTLSTSSLEDGEVVDELEDVELPGEEIPEYGVDLPDQLSSFTIAIWGENYSFPMTWQEFTDMGWEYQGDEQETVESESYLQGETFEQSGNTLTVDLMNGGAESCSVTDCFVAGIQIDTSTAGGAAIYVDLPAGIVMQKSTLEEVEAAYGDPVDCYEGETETLLTYEYGTYRSVQLGFDPENGILRRMDLKNMQKSDQEDLSEVDDTTTEEVKAYVAPEKAGDKVEDYVVEYAGQLYQLPAPTAVFEANGWTVNADESDEAVAAGKYGYVTLEKDGSKLYTVVENLGEEATTVSNCFVTSLYGDLDTTKTPIVIAGGIRLGMTEEEFLDRTGESKWEKTEDEDKQQVIYTRYSDESHTDYTEVTLDGALSLVRGIKAVNHSLEADRESLK